MMVQHYKIRGTNVEIGRELAKIAAKMKISLKPVADSLRNKLQYRYIEENYQVLYDRMKGISEVTGVKMNDYRYDLSSIPYLPSEISCSVVFYPGKSTENGHNILSRNSDMPVNEKTGQKYRSLHICSRPIIFEIYPDRGYSSLFICCIDLQGGALDGINSQGLAVALMGDGEYTDCFQPEPSFEVGINEFLILRYLLDNCKNTDEAKESLAWLKQYYTFGPMHYIISDSRGHSFVFEFSRHRNKTHIVEGNGIQCVTNHFLYEQDTTLLSSESRERLNMLTSSTTKKSIFSLEEIKEINRRVAPWMPDYRPHWLNSRTLWYSLYDLDSRSLSVKFYLGEEKDLNDSARVKTKYSDFYAFTLEH